jgi:cytosine/uracil/thiamine/allantoin permease
LRVSSLKWLYDYAWFVGFFVSATTYCVLMGRAPLVESQAAQASVAEL